MGYRRAPKIHTLDLEKDYPGFEVRMKGLKIGRMRELLKALDDDTKTEDMIPAVSQLIASNVVSWNLEDEEGRPVEPTPEAVEDFELDMLMDVVNAWLNKINGVSADLGKDSPSGAQFPGQPVTMEAL
ncbi:hypothetical protein HUN42_00022 [Streptomyces phage Dagobah]|nr:hypothetical protein HUN42_00022 [Streptomyces phage Dagobah]